MGGAQRRWGSGGGLSAPLWGWGGVGTHGWGLSGPLWGREGLGPYGWGASAPFLGIWGSGGDMGIWGDMGGDMGLGAYVAGQEPMGGRVRIPNCGGRKSHKEWARRIPESPFDFWRGVTRILGVPLFFGVGALGRLGPSGTNTPLPLRTHFRAPCPVLGPLQHPGVGLWGNALRKQAAQKGLKGAWLSGGISALIGAEIGFEITPGGGAHGDGRAVPSVSRASRYCTSSGGARAPPPPPPPRATRTRWALSL